MILKISHLTRYDYSAPVELNPHALLLKPLQRSYLDTRGYELRIAPEPEGLVERSSIEGNPIFQVWFSGKTEMLEIESSFEVEVRPFNPFSFIIKQSFIDRIDPAACEFGYSDEAEVLLYPPLQTTDNPALHEFANKLLAESPTDPITYLNALTASVHSNWEHIVREEDNLWSPEETFSAGKGSCRDLSWMLIHMLRAQGLAARFVSGYAFNPELDEGNELHAWVEAYLPGAGWVGIDPSLGLFADQHYIPLASSSDAQQTLPVHGNYGGDLNADVIAKLTTRVDIKEIGPGDTAGS